MRTQLPCQRLRIILQSVPNCAVVTLSTTADLAVNLRASITLSTVNSPLYSKLTKPLVSTTAPACTPWSVSSVTKVIKLFIAVPLDVAPDKL